MLTFTPALAPSYGSNFDKEPRVLMAKFGDGYTQRAGDGININPVKGTLIFDSLTVDQADDIEEFLDARRAVEAFLYTLPRDASPRKLRCPKWSRKPIQPGSDSITMEYEEVFDLG